MRKLCARLLAFAGALGGLLLMRRRFPRLWPCRPELIEITAPASNSTVTSPLTLSGRGRATQHNQLAVEVRDESNAVIGTGSASITGALGQSGPFTAVVSFSAPTPGSVGFVQVFDSSPATGAVTHLASVLVRFA